MSRLSLAVRLFALLLLVTLLPAGLVATADAREGERENAMRLMESMSLTPDARTVVFSWRGDLWRVPVAGGPARRLTSHPAADIRPHVSPDGKLIAFVSDRSGVEQVWVMPITGGPAKQVTLHTEGARVYDWFPDSKAVLIRTARDHDWRAAARLFRKPLDLDAPAELLFDAACGWGSVSRDGRRIAFTRERSTWWRKGYHGPSASQIWTYDLDTKAYTRVTKGDRGALWPMWGHGSTLSYVSEEDGTWNLWRHDLATGKRTRLTSYKDDGVSYAALCADGSTLVYRRLFDTYVLRAGGEPVLLVARDAGDPSVDLVDHRVVRRASAAAFTEDAREIALVAGGDLWVMDTELKEPRRITNTAEEEKEPVFSKDGTAIYFVSDAGDSPDLWRARRVDEKKYWWQNDEFLVERLTHDAEEESDLQLMPDGKHLVYQRGTDLWTSDVDGKNGRKLVSSFSGLQYDLSPDGRWIAYAKPDDDFNWDVWIAAVDGSREPFNVSRHPDNDMNPAWSPDGKVLAFTGRRWTEETDVCYVWLREEDDETSTRDRTLEKALKKMKGRKKKAAKKPGAKKAGAPKTPTAATTVDPIVGTWNGRIKGPEPLPQDGLDLVLGVTRTEEGVYGCTIDVVGQFSGTAEAFTFEAESGKVTFVAQTPLGKLSGEGAVKAEHMEGTWTIEGAMQGDFEATRAPAAEAHVEAPGKTADADAKADANKKKGKKDAAKAPKPVKIDFEDLENRVRRIPIPDSTETGLFWSPDGKKLAFQATVKGKAGLYTVQFPDKLTPTFLSAVRGSGARWLKQGNQIAWVSGGAPATLSASGKATSFRFSVRQEVSLPDLHGAAFDQAWRAMRDNFYDDRLGGRNWDAVHAKYAPMAARCATGDEFATVVSLMLGELNGSHLGYRSLERRWSKSGWRDVTGHLGCHFDLTYEGEGLRVRDVVPGTPAHEAKHRIVAGEIILAIDGRPVNGATNLTRVMTGDPQRTVDVRVRGKDGKDGKERTLHLRPTTFGFVRQKMYDAWIETTRKAVAKASDGRLGYLHVRGMNWSSFLRFEAELYKEGFGKDGLIIDVRDNGGGFTTDHLLTCLTQPHHAFTVPRRGGIGYPQDRMVYAPWNKPIVVLCNQNSFSNAEIFAHAIQTLGRGKIVGVQTAGGVISTGGTMIMGLGTLRLPFRGWFLAKDGADMELNGCVPDVSVWPKPGDLAQGIDRQVDKAVEVGLEEVAAWKRRPHPKPHYRQAR